MSRLRDLSFIALLGEHLLTNLFDTHAPLPSWRQQSDQPALQHRVVHVDLKGPKLPVAAFADLLRLLARWGINGVLVEYEHRLPELPLEHQFPQADRYGSDELARLLDLASDLAIEWIPLFQTLGHCEYLRRLPGTTGLAENPDDPSQLCPSSPQVRQYLLHLFDLVCKLHPHSRFVHVGLDETQWLGHCPACNERAQKLGGRMELYLDHCIWVCTEAVRRGRVPMLWGDMFLGEGRLDLVSRLPREAVVLPWEYSATSDLYEQLWYAGRRPCRAPFQCDYSGTRLAAPLPAMPKPGGFAEDLSAAQLAEVGGLDAATGLARSFGQVRLMAKRARRLWGTGAAQMSAHGMVHSNFLLGALNCNQLVRELARSNGEGAIATCWARGHSLAPINAPWPLSLYAFAQFAASAWSGRTDPADLEARAGEIAHELGMPERLGDWRLDDVLWTLSHPAPLSTAETVAELLEGCEGHSVFADSLILAVAMRRLVARLAFMVEEGRWWHPNAGDLPPKIAAGMKVRQAEIDAELQALQPRARQHYLRWVGQPHDFELWWRGVFGADQAFARSAIELVNPRG